MDPYPEVWERFIRDRRLEFGGHKDPAWQGGHALSASLLVPVDAERFQERLGPLKDALRPFPFVSLHPNRFMHITLVLLGFLVPEPESDDEISRARLEGIEAAARPALAGFPAFPVRLANLNAFPGAAFVEAHDGGMLDELRNVLCASCGLRKPAGPPHLTLAYFQAPDGTPAPERLISAIAPYRHWPVGEFLAANVELTLLDLHQDHPKPQTLAEMPLGRGFRHQASGVS